MANGISHKTFHALWDTLFDTIFQMTERKLSMGKHTKSRDKYSETFTVHSLYQIFKPLKANSFQVKLVFYH